jgi:phenylpropionate dioxygenase-like ring-hydroxylating dioxygenase large terminal subunit
MDFLGEYVASSRFIIPGCSSYNELKFRILFDQSVMVSCDWMHAVENVLDGSHIEFLHSGSLKKRSNKWLKNLRAKNDPENFSDLIIQTADFGFSAEAERDEEINGNIKKIRYVIDLFYSSIVIIKINLGNSGMAVWQHVVPISNSVCRIEKAFMRNFLTHQIFNPIFSSASNKFLRKNISVLESTQSSYIGGQYWET